MMEYTIIIVCFVIGAVIAIRYFGNLLDFVTEKVSSRGLRNGPWKTHLGVGRKHTSRIEKAAIARIGLGANDSDETIYWNAFVDDKNNDLRSENEYQIVFSSEPLVRYKDKGFWSITVYGNNKFLIPNPYNKYMVRSGVNTGLSEDSKFSIFLSRNKPADTANWIPLSETDENFTIAFRCYVPENDMMTNAKNIKLPSITKV